MARRSRKCAVEDCERRARSGKVVCLDHENTALGKRLAHEVQRLEREMRSLLKAESPEEQRLVAKRFRQRVERGDFAALFANRAQQLLERPRATTFEDELGALRVAMMRVLMLEDDPAKLALAISQISNATVRATRAQEDLEGVAPPREHLERSVDKLERVSERINEDAEWGARKRQTLRSMTPAEARDQYGPVRQYELLREGVERTVREQEERIRRMYAENDAAGEPLFEPESSEFETDQPFELSKCVDDPAEPPPGMLSPQAPDIVPDPDPLTYLEGKAWEEEYQRSVWELDPWIHAERMQKLYERGK